MLGFIGRWAASKGMVAVPNLIGLLNTAAQTAIANSGLTFSSSSTTNTGDSGLANKVASQTPTAGTLADYESSVSFVYYTYVAPPFFPFFPPYFNPTPFFPPYFNPTPFFPPYFVAPPTISGVSVSSITNTGGTLTWTSTGQASYSISTSPSTDLNGSTGNTATSRLITGGTPNTEYSVTVTVYSGSSQTGSSASGSTTFTTTGSVAPFFPPYFNPTPFFPPYFAPAAVYRECTSSDISNGYCLYLGECLDATIYGTTGPICTPGGTSPFFPPYFATTYAIWSGCYNGVTEGAGYGSGPTAAGWSLATGTTENGSLTESEIRALIGGGCPAAPFFPPYFAPAPFFPPYFAPACTEFGGPCGNCCEGLFCTTFCCGPSCSDPGCFDGGSC